MDNILIKCIFFLDGENSLAWCWLDLDDAEILKSVLKRMKEVNNLDPIGFLAEQSYQSTKGNTVLHILAKDPIEANDIRLDLIMDLLKAGCKPSVRNYVKRTFLEESMDLQLHLPEKIKGSSDDWVQNIMTTLASNIGGEYF